MTFQPTMQLRVQKRPTFNSDGGHCNYVLQQLFEGTGADLGFTEWRDVPVVDERAREAKYE